MMPILLSAADDIRPYLNTGPWYPADPAQLQRMLDGFFDSLPLPAGETAVRGIIAPHAGFLYSGRCAAKAYRALAPSQGIRRVILMGASHSRGFHGACVADYGAYATPLGTMAVDVGICRALAAKELFQSNRDTMRFEHALENQLPFLQKALGNDGYKLVPIVFGSLAKKEFEKLAAAIAPFVDAHTLVVASSDLTHYGESFSYTPFKGDIKGQLTALDTGFIEAVRLLDFDKYYQYHERTGITACGFVPIGVLIQLFKNQRLKCSLADYYKSGDLNGDYSTSVSYASLLFMEGGAGKAAAESIGLDRAEKKMLLELARSTLEEHFLEKSAASGDEDRFSAHARLKEKRGVFVTLREKGELRGCIGSIIGVEPLYRGVMANALHAALDDPRFEPLPAGELNRVEIEISVMTPLRPISDYRSIRLGSDGVVIRDGHAQAVYLPQVATETGWNLDQFLASLCAKAGLQRDAYQSSPTMQFYVFQAQVFGEKDSGK
ncbi:MAG: AmmeMemoRadiSam system protein B [Candidatus Aminicenantes bacterium]|nr:AmmeMemoRadiSam system protein B [Candidatus Aminicenantes bacterium]